jgi:cytochrome b
MEIKVWDLPVRLFHWSLVVLVLMALFTGDNEPGLGATIHAFVGYGICVLILFRLV